jgi:hypothetical protein
MQLHVVSFAFLSEIPNLISKKFTENIPLYVPVYV